MAVALLSGGEGGHLSTPQRKMKAIHVAETEEELSDSGIADVATLFVERDMHDTYLSFSNKGARRIWLERQLAKLEL